MGLGLYGINPDEDFIPISFDLKPALKLFSNVVQVKKIKKGDKVGYGATYEASEDEWIGVVPIGYADGWIRLHQGRNVIVNGVECEIVGRVCMDQFMIDVTDIPYIKVEDEVTLVGTDGDAVLTMEEISNNAHSFNYELPCKIARRVPRVYYRNGKIVKTVKNIFNR